MLGARWRPGWHTWGTRRVDCPGGGRPGEVWPRPCAVEFWSGNRRRNIGSVFLGVKTVVKYSRRVPATSSQTPWRRMRGCEYVSLNENKSNQIKSNLLIGGGVPTTQAGPPRFGRRPPVSPPGGVIRVMIVCITLCAGAISAGILVAPLFCKMHAFDQPPRNFAVTKRVRPNTGMEQVPRIYKKGESRENRKGERTQAFTP